MEASESDVTSEAGFGFGPVLLEKLVAIVSSSEVELNAEGGISNVTCRELECVVRTEPEEESEPSLDVVDIWILEAGNEPGSTIG